MQATKAAAKELARGIAAHILVVDDEKSICELLEITFRKEGHRVEVAHNVDSAKRKLESQIFDIVISDVKMPGESGVELLKFTKEIAPDCFFLLVTGVPTLETAIAAINAGADRYVIKDHDLVDQLRRAVRNVAESLKWKKEAGYLRRELRRLTGLDNIIGQSAKMRAIFDLIQTVAPQSSRVLITGESGTGKELVARAIHENSCASAGAVYHHQLRGLPGNAAGIGAVRIHEGRFHRSQRKSARPVPGGARRHAVHGRDWKHDLDHAGEAVPGAAGGEGPSPRQHRRDRRGRAGDRCDQQGL
jgi:DNA-binding NtrC family response regulator